MPLATIHLISVSPSSTLTSLLKAIRSTPSHVPIILSKPIRWIIVPEKINTEQLLSPSKPWDLLYIHTGTEALPDPITKHINDHYALQTGIPSRLLKDFETTNKSLLHPSPGKIPPLTNSQSSTNLLTNSSQDLTLSHDLQRWVSEFAHTKTGKSAMSMLNFLAFIPERKAEYLQYGQAFAQSIGSKRGGNAKLVGNIVHPDSDRNTQTDRWDEFALAHYPSILHFAEMLASRDYQEVNQKYRVGALKDTCILCTSEIEIEDLVDGRARL